MAAGVNWTQVEALTAVAVASFGSASHFTGRLRNRNRMEDAMFGYGGEPGVLERLRHIEERLSMWDGNERRHRV